MSPKTADYIPSGGGVIATLLGPRSIGRIDPVDPADPRNGTRCSGGSDRIVRHVPKRRSKSIQYGGRLSNVLTTCFYVNYGRCIELCCQNDTICCESDIILQKSTSLLRFQSTDIPDIVQSACVLYISW